MLGVGTVPAGQVLGDGTVLAGHSLTLTNLANLAGFLAPATPPLL